MRSIVLMVLFLLLSAGTVLAQGGAALSFAPALQNAAPCTIVVEPGASIQKAISPARSGAVICVRGGVYVEALKIIPVNTGITLMAIRREAHHRRREQAAGAYGQKQVRATAFGERQECHCRWSGNPPFEYAWHYG